jgi:hypothetical protein
VVKHFNKIIIEAIQSMFHHKNNLKYWAKPINTMTYLKARSLLETVKRVTLEEAWNMKKPIANEKGSLVITFNMFSYQTK